MSMHDVYAFGVIASSTLIELEGEFPPPAGYAEIAAVYPSIGGEAAGSAFVLARLGIATKLQGNRLSDDDPSAQVLETLSGAGVDCTAITVDARTPPVREVVVAHGSDRTIFGTYTRLLAERAWEAPSRQDIAASQIVCVDPFFGEQSRMVSRWCRESATPYVTIDTAPDSGMARYADVLIISEEYASRSFDVGNPRRVLSAYTDRTDALVILTRGGRELWFGRASDEPRTTAPFDVPIRDTAGAGDSFRAGIIYGMLQGQTDEELIRTASAISALVCRRPPGVLNSPTVEELEGFLRSAT